MNIQRIPTITEARRLQVLHPAAFLLDELDPKRRECRMPVPVPPDLWTSCLTSKPYRVPTMADLERPIDSKLPPLHETLCILMGTWNPARHVVFVPPWTNPMRPETTPPPAEAPPTSKPAPAEAERINPMRREIGLRDGVASEYHKVDPTDHAVSRVASAASGAPTAPPNQNPVHRENGPPAPHRPGPLRNGNPRGNPNAAPRCGCKTRLGRPCLGPAMKNGRCRMHGGASTGPRTPEGRARVAAAHTKHGYYTAQGRAFFSGLTDFLRRGRNTLALVRGNRDVDIEALAHLLMPPAPQTARVNPMRRENRAPPGDIWAGDAPDTGPKASEGKRARGPQGLAARPPKSRGINPIHREDAPDRVEGMHAGRNGTSNGSGARGHDRTLRAGVPNASFGGAPQAWSG